MVEPRHTTGFSREIATRLLDLASRHPEEKNQISEIIALLTEHGLPQHGVAQSLEGVPTSRLSADYSAIQKNGKWFLMERRPGKQPFLVPESVVVAAMKVMGSHPEAKPFPDILAEVQRKVGKKLPDYALRTVIRWGRSASIVRKTGTEYVRVTGFEQKAIPQWHRLQRDSQAEPS